MRLWRLVGLGTLIVTLAALAAGCGSEEAAPPASSPPAATEETAGETGEPAVETAAGASSPEPASGIETSASSLLSPPLEMDVPAGADVQELSGSWSFAFDENVGSIGIVSLQDSSSALADPSSEQPLPEGANPSGIYLETVPQEGSLEDWLKQHPRLELTEAGTVSIAGIEAPQYDVTVAEPYESPNCQPEPECVVLFGLEELAPGEFNGGLAVTPALQTRVIAADIEQTGDPILIFLEAPSENAQAFFEQAEDVVSTLRVAE